MYIINTKVSSALSIKLSTDLSDCGYVGWQIKLCDPMWQVMLCSSEIGFF